jgi:hypothetical protein
MLRASPATDFEASMLRASPATDFEASVHDEPANRPLVAYEDCCENRMRSTSDICARWIRARF